MEEPVKKKSRFVNVGRTRGIIDVCTTTSDSDEPLPPKPKVQKPRKARKKKVVYRPPADSDSSDDFADDSGNEWRPVKRDRTIRSKVPIPITEMIAMHLSRKKRERDKAKSSIADNPVSTIPPPPLSNPIQDKPTVKSERAARIFEKLNDIAKEFPPAESDRSSSNQKDGSDKPCSPLELMKLIEEHRLCDVQLYSDDSSNENHELESTRNCADEVIELKDADFEISPLTKLALSCMQLYFRGKLVEVSDNPMKEFEEWLESGPKLLQRQLHDENVKHIAKEAVNGNDLYSGLITDSFPLTYVMLTERERLPQGSLLNPLKCNVIECIANSCSKSSNGHRPTGLLDDINGDSVTDSNRSCKDGSDGASKWVAHGNESTKYGASGNLGTVTYGNGLTKNLSNSSPFKCLHCDYKTTDRSNLKRHMLRHVTKADLPFKCLQCDYAATRHDQFKQHMLSRHGSKADLPFKCLQCDYAAARHDQFKQHMLYRHSSKADLPFKCLKCDYAAANRGHFKDHMLSRHASKADLPFKCLKCYYATAHRGHFKDHMLSRHASKADLPFKCLKCDYVTAHRGHFKTHMLSRHGSKADLAFKCLLCDYATALHGNLKAHMLSKHVSKADLPYKCLICDYAVAQHCNFKNHMLSRHGSKGDLPFKCVHCDYAAARQDRFKKHMLSRHA